MKHPARNLIIIAGCVQLLTTARVLGFAAIFRWLPEELKNGAAALRSVELALAAEAEMIA